MERRPHSSSVQHLLLQLRELAELAADAEPGSLRVNVNGQDATLETVRARNWFVDLQILNHPDNPLILKATFNPLSDGPLGVFSPLGAFKALLGFQVTEIQTPYPQTSRLHVPATVRGFFCCREEFCPAPPNSVLQM